MFVINKIFKLLLNQDDHCINEIEWDRVSDEVVDEIRLRGIR
jgi:hypothetical protein